MECRGRAGEVYGAPIWFLHPWPDWIMMAAYHVTTWGFIGLAIALIVKPEEAA